MAEAVLPDTEWAVREYLRAELPAVKVWFDTPRGTPTFPMIVIGGRIGGAPDGTALDVPRLSFSCWGGPGGNGRSLAWQAVQLLTEALADLENVQLDLDTHGYTVTVDNIVWVPDDSDPDNVLARYVVDATFGVRSV